MLKVNNSIYKDIAINLDLLYISENRFVLGDIVSNVYMWGDKFVSIDIVSNFL